MLKCAEMVIITQKVNDKTFTHSQNKGIKTTPESADVWSRHQSLYSRDKKKKNTAETKMSQSGLSFTKHAVKTSRSDSENDLAFHYLSVSISKESH